MRKSYLPFLLFVCFFFSNFKSFSQTRIVDSLKSILKKQQIADSTKAKTLIALAWEIKYDNVNAAIKISKEGIELSKKTNRFADIATGLKILGIINDETFHFKESIDYYLNSISYYQKLHDTISIARVECNIGMLYRKIDQNKEAIKYFTKCFPVFEKANFIPGLNITNQNMGICYFNLKNYDSALVYFFRSLEILKANKMTDATIYGNIGNCYSMKKDKVKAEKYITSCLNEFIQNADSSSLFYFWKYNLANIYAETGRISESIKILEDCRIGLEKLGLTYSEQNTNQLVNLAINYAKDKKFELAYKNVLTAIKIKDTIFNKDFAGQMNEMKEKYEADKNELSISNLNKEKKLKDVEIKQQSQQKYIFGIGLLLMLVLSFILYNNFTRKKKDNIIIQNQKNIVDEKNKEITDSITYAKRIQTASLPTENYIQRNMERLKKKE